MKGITKAAAVVATTALLTSLNASATYGTCSGGSCGGETFNDVPEMDAAMAPLALGLVAGITALVADRRRNRRK